jgi:hypothetical protein
MLVLVLGDSVLLEYASVELYLKQNLLCASGDI